MILFLFFSLALLQSRAISQRYFENKDTHAMPWSQMGARSCEAGDIDGDGDLDVIGGRSYLGYTGLTHDWPVFLWLNEGKGCFKDVSKRIALGTGMGNYLAQPRFADVDNDRDLDVIVGYSYQFASKKPQIRVFLNNGKGSFQELANAAALSYGSNLWFDVVDADGDGDVDIALTAGGKVLFLANDGKGVFTRAKGGSGGWFKALNEVVPIDADKDGDADLLLLGTGTYENAPIPLLYQNDGKGALKYVGSGTLPKSGLSLGKVRVADLTGDGIDDVVCVGSYTDKQQRTRQKPVLWRGDGKGGFQDVPLPIPANFTDDLSDIAIADLDGDKDIDILWFNRNPASLEFGQVRILENLGKQKFVFSKKVPSGTVGRWADRILLGDLDGDKRTDVLLVGQHGHLWLRDPKYGYRSGGRDQIADAGYLGPYHIADINRDGYPDLIHNRGWTYGTPKGVTGFPVELFYGTPGGQMVPAPRSAMPGTRCYPRGYATGDFDGDGDVDMTIARDAVSPSGPALFNTLLFLNQGKGVFKDFTGQLPDAKDPATAVTALDADRDGDLDLVVARGLKHARASGQPPFYMGMPQRNRLFINSGKGVFKEAPASQFPTVADNTSCLATGDLDLDGDTDLVIANMSYRNQFNAKVPGRTRVFLNDGKGSFKEKIGGFPVTAYEPTDIEIADLDGDRKPDLFMSVYQGPGLLFLGDGKGGFTKASGIPLTTGNLLGVTVGDVDEDGDADVVVLRGMNPQDKWGHHLLFRNDGKKGFRWIQDGVPEELRVQDSLSPPVLMDMDGDGDLDLVALGQVFENNLRQISYVKCPRTGFPLEVMIEAAPGRNPVARVSALYAQLGAWKKAVAIPPFGQLFLDPSRTVLLGIQVIPAPGGSTRFMMQVPNIPALRGRDLSLQAILASGANLSAWRFTNLLQETIR